MSNKPLDDGFNPVTLHKLMSRDELIEWLRKLWPGFDFAVTVTRQNVYDDRPDKHGNLISYHYSNITITSPPEHTYPHD